MWNPDLYLKFKNERTRPAKDLLASIDLENPKRILDIGCGPGNSSRLLKDRWPDASVIGIDLSESMLKKAKSNNPDIEFLIRDASMDISDLGKFDCIFSNAALQWIDGIEVLLKNYYKMLYKKGVMAMQIPNPINMPIQTAVIDTADDPRWSNLFFNFFNGLHLFEPEQYYNMICKLGGNINLWETSYNHVLPGFNEIVQWYRSTGMKPYLEKLTKNEQQVFMDLVYKRVAEQYIINEDGTVLFPFRRIFFTIAKK